MPLNDFRSVKRLFKHAIREILSTRSDFALNEAALPAYSHRNPLIDYVFWNRINVAWRLAAAGQGKNILDFGCGTGVMSYLLAVNGFSVDAVDTEFGPLNLIRSFITFPEGIRFHNRKLMDVPLEPRSFDSIVALDVLEHIDGLGPYLEHFRTLLRPGGRVIVSGPTENILYSIGRKLAGREFTGEYHVRNIGSIRKAFDKRFSTTMEAKLMWPFTLFGIFTAVPK